MPHFVKGVLRYFLLKYLNTSLRGGAQAADGVVSDRGRGGRGAVPGHDPHPRGRHSAVPLEKNKYKGQVGIYISPF